MQLTIVVINNSKKIIESLKLSHNCLKNYPSICEKYEEYKN